MLVLSRQVNEIVVLGGGDSGYPEIQVQVVDIRGDKVRLGFVAPQSVPVHRKEVYEAILASSPADLIRHPATPGKKA